MTHMTDRDRVINTVLRFVALRKLRSRNSVVPLWLHSSSTPGIPTATLFFDFLPSEISAGLHLFFDRYFSRPFKSAALIIFINLVCQLALAGYKLLIRAMIDITVGFLLSSLAKQSVRKSEGIHSLKNSYPQTRSN